MGWDCFATRNDGRDLDAGDLAAFIAAADTMQALHAGEDGFLRTGGLNLSGCGSAIHDLTGLDVYAEDPAAAATVAGHLPASWDFTGDFYVDNALAFLRVCTDRGLGIQWSW